MYPVIVVYAHVPNLVHTNLIYCISDILFIGSPHHLLESKSPKIDAAETERTLCSAACMLTMFTQCCL